MTSDVIFHVAFLYLVFYDKSRKTNICRSLLKESFQYTANVLEVFLAGGGPLGCLVHQPFFDHVTGVVEAVCLGIIAHGGGITAGTNGIVHQGFEVRTVVTRTVEVRTVQLLLALLDIVLPYGVTVYTGSEQKES